MIQLQIDPSGAAPVSVPLVELPGDEGRLRAMTILKRVCYFRRISA